MITMLDMEEKDCASTTFVGARSAMVLPQLYDRKKDERAEPVWSGCCALFVL
jgi:hypothetical protein